MLNNTKRKTSSGDTTSFIKDFLSTPRAIRFTKLNNMPARYRDNNRLNKKIINNDPATIR
jgi:hypothetical protein